MKVDASHAATTACTSIALVPEGRQRIVVCYRTIIKKVTNFSWLLIFSHSSKREFARKGPFSNIWSHMYGIV